MYFTAEYGLISLSDRTEKVIASLWGKRLFTICPCCVATYCYSYRVVYIYNIPPNAISGNSKHHPTESINKEIHRGHSYEDVTFAKYMYLYLLPCYWWLLWLFQVSVVVSHETCDVSRALVTSNVCRFCTSVLPRPPILFQTVCTSPEGIGKVLQHDARFVPIYLTSLYTSVKCSNLLLFRFSCEKCTELLTSLGPLVTFLSCSLKAPNYSLF